MGSVPIPKFQHPSHALLEENGFKQMKYVKFYKRCMEDRTKHGHGHSEEMNTLFRWALGEGAGGRLRGRCWGSRHDEEEAAGARYCQGRCKGVTTGRFGGRLNAAALKWTCNSIGLRRSKGMCDHEAHRGSQ